MQTSWQSFRCATTKRLWAKRHLQQRRRRTTKTRSPKRRTLAQGLLHPMPHRLQGLRSKQEIVEVIVLSPPFFCAAIWLANELALYICSVFSRGHHGHDMLEEPTG